MAQKSLEGLIIPVRKSGGEKRQTKQRHCCQGEHMLWTIEN